MNAGLLTLNRNLVYHSGVGWRWSAPYFYAFLKRGVDLVAAASGLVLLAPLFGLVAIAIKIDSPGPVFFRQRRVGLRGRRFAVYKFRTMVKDASKYCEKLKALNEADGVLFKIKKDPRITRVGRILRRTSLDELPQLINVLKGEMSLVGPRPALPHEVSEYTSRMRTRLKVPAGMTGLWQIGGRSTLSCRRGMAFDLLYVRKCGLLFDLLILILTVPAVLTGRGAW